MDQINTDINMKRYIAYFDFLGYKELILNNDHQHLKLKAGFILRDIEMALGQDKFQEPKAGIIHADISMSRINCLNISDTVVFWTNDDTIESLVELLAVANKFNREVMKINIPARGVIHFAEFEMLSGQTINKTGAIYSANLIYGKGLVTAHIKCESQSWAGCTIDETVIEQIKSKVEVASFLKPFAKLYSVPYKTPLARQKKEYAMTLVNGDLNDAAFKNYSDAIIRTFKADNKSIDNPRVKEILDNTIKFLQTFKA